MNLMTSGALPRSSADEIWGVAQLFLWSAQSEFAASLTRA